MIEEVLRGYEAVSEDWIARSEAISPERLFAPVADLLPAAATRVADIGAGAGRDAAWLAARGHRVVAVEPVARFRRAGMARHRSPAITWIDDRLPELARLQGPEAFGLVLLTGVWQHLDEGARRQALPRLAAITAPGGLLILALRHGPGAPGRPVRAIRPRDTIEAARAAGFTLLRQRPADSIQEANRAAGVHWTWLALRREGEAAAKACR